MKEYIKKPINEITQFYDIPNIDKKQFIISSQYGKLTNLQTEDTELIQFAKSKGLKLK